MSLNKALNGGRGALDAWLEVNNEEEVRQAINEMLSNAVAAEREACAKVAEQETRLSRISLSNILGDDGVCRCHVAAAIRARGEA